jgi:septal ring factor EnvC (AmiA/AmiB activator)
LANDITLREPVLPSQEDWTNALSRVKAIFGIGANEHHLSSSAVQRLGDELATKVRDLDRGATDLVGALEAHSDVLGLGDVSPRLGTARRARDLIGGLGDAADHVDRIRVIAEFDLPEELQPLARSTASAAVVAAALQGANWQLLNQLPSLSGERAVNALAALRRAAGAEQMHVDLAPALAAAAQEVTHILVDQRGKEAQPDDDSAAEQERARREQEDQLRREQEEELRRREQEAADRERRLREQEEEFRRRQAEAQREAERRASQEHTVEVEGVAQLETLLEDLVQELSRPVEGKKLRIDWRWL